MNEVQRKFTTGSLFAGIGGFDLGFERAGFETAWQVEINPAHRAHLAHRFPKARQYADVCTVTGAELGPVDCLLAGFPCQDLSSMGARRKGGRQGLNGKRSGLFWQVCRLIDELEPTWVVLENVVGLLSAHDGADLQAVIEALDSRGYVGAWRVLDSRYFGVPQGRRRVFIVASHRYDPPLEFLADAGAMEALPITLGSEQIARGPMAHAVNTLSATNVSSRINLGAEVLVSVADGWDQMVERERVSELHGIPKGLDVPNFYARYAAGNAIVPACAEWVAKKIKAVMEP